MTSLPFWGQAPTPDFFVLEHRCTRKDSKSLPDRELESGSAKNLKENTNTRTGTYPHTYMHTCTHSVTLKKPNGVLYQRVYSSKSWNHSRPLILFRLHSTFFRSSHLSFWNVPLLYFTFFSLQILLPFFLSYCKDLPLQSVFHRPGSLMLLKQFFYRFMMGSSKSFPLTYAKFPSLQLKVLHSPHIFVLISHYFSVNPLSQSN